MARWTLASAPPLASSSSSVGPRLLSSSATAAQASAVELEPSDPGPGPAYSKYEYPTRKEPPIISRNTPQQAQQAAASRAPSKLKIDNYDPFDDSCSLSDDQVSDLLGRQKQEQLQLEASMSSFPIEQQMPSFIPPNVPSQELEAPETQITTLPNGVRVVSLDAYGQMCTVGVIVNAGSRHEKLQGSAHLLETLAFFSTKEYPDATIIPKLLLDWGATRFVNANREQTLYSIDVLRPNVEKAMHLISQVVLEPNFHQLEVEECKMLLGFQAEAPIPELLLGEALQVAAYGADQQLGRHHFATLENIPQLSAESIRQYWESNIRHNPEGTVVAGTGIGHQELVDMTTKYFGAMEQKSSPVTVPSAYRGGFEAITPIPPEHPAPPTLEEVPVGESLMPNPEDYGRIALAFPIGGWHSQHEMVSACVLQTLLGGGSSFSAGGPGKGMYTRLYRQVLNQHKNVESAEAFTAFTDENGLMGILGSTASESTMKKITLIFAEQLAKIAATPVSDEELSRAINMLKCNVLSQLESRLVRFEDIGRQVLTYGKREDSQTTCARIDAVSASDIQQVAMKMLQSHPTVAATGQFLDQVPDDKEVSRWFRG